MEIAGYNIPEDLYYDERHFWVRVEGDELVIGMDDFAEKLAGQIVFVQLPFVGKAVTAGWTRSTVRPTAEWSPSMRNWKPTPASLTAIVTARAGCTESSPRT